MKRKRERKLRREYNQTERINRATAKAALNNARGAKSMVIVAEKVTKEKDKVKREQDQNIQLEEKKRRSKVEGLNRETEREVRSRSKGGTKPERDFSFCRP